MSPITDDDLDRLADYVAGLLDPAESAEVDRLIATDTGWARAHAALAASVPLVDRALAQLPAEPMPPELAARLDSALRREAAGTGSKVIDLGRARRWRRAALATTAVAAAAAAVVGGLAALTNGNNFSGSASSKSMADQAAPQAAQGFAAAPPTRSSGTNYTRATLGGPQASGKAAGAATIPEPSAQAAAPSVRGNAQGQEGTHDNAGGPAELSRLTDPAALRGCLDAITAVEGGRPVGVDYARYEGAPALIVTLVGGRVTAVAAGADCGLAGSGAALLASAP